MDWLLLAALAAQPPNPSQLLAPDSGRAIARARTAQEGFESERRRRLPVIPTGGGRCEERIGRFCSWYDERDTSLPAEPEAVISARDRLNLSLAEADAERPGSNWILGQRVRYLAEHQRPVEGLAVAAQCGATPWWCSALAGLALHLAARFQSADSAFDRALAEMPAEVRCAWTDWTVVFDNPVAKQLAGQDCEGRRRLADSLLFLAKPLLSEPGNDLRTELLSRRTMAALLTHARSPHFIAWGRDLEELMLRYGWSTRWSVNDRPPSLAESPGVTGHQRSPAYQFFPTQRPGQPWRWNLSPERARFRYAPSYADRFVLTDEAQMARFPRGDTTLVVAGSVPGPDTVTALTAIGTSGQPVVIRADSVTPLGGLVARLAGRPVMASVETRTRQGRQVAATRVVFEPDSTPGSLILSDPLFFAVADDLPESLEAAVARALPANRFSKRMPVGIYWEATGPGHDSLAVAVAIIPARRGPRGRPTMSLQWRATGGAFELDLRRQKPGQYLLRLEARAAGTTAASQRAFVLLP